MGKTDTFQTKCLLEQEKGEEWAHVQGTDH